jgi:hypothetical protein
LTISDGLGDHFDRSRRTLLDADAAALAVVQVERVTVGFIDLEDRVVGAHPVAGVTAKAVAAGETPARLEQRVSLIESLRDLVASRPIWR